MNTLLVLVRREVWENRSLWIAPLAIAGFILVMALFGAIHAGDQGVFSIGSSEGPKEEELREVLGNVGKQEGIYGMAMASFTMFHMMVLSIVIFFYLLDSLMTERKDRSILFWKSLPISDVQVVSSKALTALVVAPLFVLLVSAATQLLFGLIWWVRMHGSPIANVLIPFDAGTWLQVQAGSLVMAFVSVVWLLPVAGYLMLVSVWVRRNAFLWAVLPPVAAMAGEYLLLRTHYAASFVGRRLVGDFQIMDSPEFSGAGDDGLAEFVSRAGSVLVHWETWAGIAAAVAMFVAVVRIRRYRDDS